MILFATLLIISSSYSLEDRICLAEAIYYEAGHEKTIKAKELIGHVVLNRTKNKHYPNTICLVIKQPKQFPFKRIAKDKKYWIEAQRIANLVLLRDILWKYNILLTVSKEEAKGLLAFMNPKLTNNAVKKSWKRKGFYPVLQVERHIFYRK